jgi:hypothetical protein
MTHSDSRLTKVDLNLQESYVWPGSGVDACDLSDVVHEGGLDLRHRYTPIPIIGPLITTTIYHKRCRIFAAGA